MLENISRTYDISIFSYALGHKDRLRSLLFPLHELISLSLLSCLRSFLLRTEHFRSCIKINLCIFLFPFVLFPLSSALFLSLSLAPLPLARSSLFLCRYRNIFLSISKTPSSKSWWRSQSITKTKRPSANWRPRSLPSGSPSSGLRPTASCILTEEEGAAASSPDLETPWESTPPQAKPPHRGWRSTPQLPPFSLSLTTFPSAQLRPFSTGPRLLLPPSPHL